MEPVEFDQLPELCLRKILSFLNLRDLIKFRAVSRQFKVYAEETPLELMVSDHRKECSFCCRWYQTDRRIKLGNSISPSAFASMRSSPLKLEQQLKFLHFHFKRTTPDFDIGILNSLQQLAHLELALGPGKTTLSLPNLRVLYVRFGLDKRSFVLKTPKLEVLACFTIANIQAEHPETIKRIECDCDDMNDLAPFKNLQFLVCHCGFDLGGVRLSNWRHLKELQIQSESLCEMAEDEPDFEEFRRSLVNLMRNRSESKREELKLYLDEVLLVNPVEQLVGCFRHPYVYDSTGAKTSHLHSGSDLFLFKNYQYLRRHSYPHVTSVHFDELMDLDVELSSEFFDRFPRVRKLSASGPIDPDRFEWFLQNATALRELILNNTSLGQAFMERLPQMNSRFICLEVNKSRLIKNFDFVLQIKQLRAFRTDRELGLDLAAKAFRQLNDLCGLDFRAGREVVVIARLSPIKNEYTLRFYASRVRTETFRRDHLKWAELVALYDQRRATNTAGRARLQ